MHPPPSKLLSAAWAPLLQSLTPNDQPIKGTHHAFFAKLIILLWNAQTTFWTAYQDRRHKETDTDQQQDTAKLLEVKEEVTYLYSLRKQVLPSHNQSYFPLDIASFLQYSTQAQLQSYVTNYGAAIKKSIKQCREQSTANTRSIHTYQGFQRITNTAPPNQPPHNGDTIAPDVIHNTATPPMHPEIPPPPLAPNEPPAQAIKPRRNQVQQSILTTFRRIRNIRAITTTPLHEPPIPHLPINPTAEYQTVGDYIHQMSHRPLVTSTSTTETTDNNTPPVTATRAPSHYKHSKWRPAALVREKFSQYFRKR